MWLQLFDMRGWVQLQFHEHVLHVQLPYAFCFLDDVQCQYICAFVFVLSSSVGFVLGALANGWRWRAHLCFLDICYLCIFFLLENKVLNLKVSSLLFFQFIIKFSKHAKFFGCSRI